MRNIRIVFVPVLILAALCGLAMLEIDVTGIAQFGFIWDVLLGGVIGAALALLPAMAGFNVRRNAQTSLLWVCGFVTLLLIFYQYMTLVTGMRIEALAFLAAPGTRMRIAEGVMLGYCSFIAGRGKV